MNKLAKRISAVVLAGAMTLSSSIAAFAADMTVYYRTYNSDATTDEEKFAYYGSETVTGVDSSKTIAQALKSYYKGRAKWNNVTAEDGTVDAFLESLQLVGQESAWASENSYPYLEPDHSHGKWVGKSWMWCDYAAGLKNVKYPENSLSRVNCSDTDFAIILSYDTSSMTW